MAMENTPFLYFPVKNPINHANLFGANPAYYLGVLGTNGHPGIDFECPLYTPIHAPCDADAFYASDKYHGDGIDLRIPDNNNPTGAVILWHLPDRSDKAHWVIPNGDGVVTHVKAGQLIGYTGNSGYPQESNGPHLHVAFQYLNGPTVLNYDNGFHGCVNPLPLFNGQFAEDIATKAQIVSTSANIVSLVATATDQEIPHAQKLSLLQDIEQYIKSLLP